MVLRVYYHIKILSYLKNRSSDKTVKNYVQGNASSKSSFIKAGLKYLFSSNSNVKTHYTYYGRTKFKVITKTLKLKDAQPPVFCLRLLHCLRYLPVASRLGW